MKSKIVLLMISLVITISAVAGATYAWFTDSAVSTANTFTTGTVIIRADRATGDPIPGPMFFTDTVEGGTASLEGNATGLWHPGKVETRHMNVYNTGSLNVRIAKVGAVITSISGNTSIDELSLADSFADSMKVKIYVSNNPFSMVLYEGTFAELRKANVCKYKREIAASGSVQLAFEITMLDGAGNDLQGIKPVVSFWIEAEQTANNPELN